MGLKNAQSTRLPHVDTVTELCVFGRTSEGGDEVWGFVILELLWVGQ